MSRCESVKKHHVYLDKAQIWEVRIIDGYPHLSPRVEHSMSQVGHPLEAGQVTDI